MKGDAPKSAMGEDQKPEKGKKELKAEPLCRRRRMERAQRRTPALEGGIKI